MTASRKSRDVTVHYGTCPQCGVAGQLFRVGYCAHCTIAHQETQIKALKQLIPSETASIPRRSLQAMRWSADIFGWSARDQQERAMLMGIDIEDDQDVDGFWRALRRELTVSASGQTDVWELHNRTMSMLFATEEAAKAYLSTFPVSVSGGMEITRRHVLVGRPDSRGVCE
jgi:hypothetical protein